MPNTNEVKEAQAPIEAKFSAEQALIWMSGQLFDSANSVEQLTSTDEETIFAALENFCQVGKDFSYLATVVGNSAGEQERANMQKRISKYADAQDAITLPTLLHEVESIDISFPELKDLLVYFIHEVRRPIQAVSGAFDILKSMKDLQETDEVQRNKTLQQQAQLQEMIRKALTDLVIFSDFFDWREGVVVTYPEKLKVLMNFVQEKLRWIERNQKEGKHLRFGDEGNVRLNIHFDVNAIFSKIDFYDKYQSNFNVPLLIWLFSNVFTNAERAYTVKQQKEEAVRERQSAKEKMRQTTSRKHQEAEPEQKAAEAQVEEVKEKPLYYGDVFVNIGVREIQGKLCWYCTAEDRAIGFPQGEGVQRLLKKMFGMRRSDADERWYLPHVLKEGVSQWNDKVKGTGFGLKPFQHFVEQSGGTFQVGTVFDERGKPIGSRAEVIIPLDEKK